jgi:hypothetical protein
MCLLAKCLQLRFSIVLPFVAFSIFGISVCQAATIKSILIHDDDPIDGKITVTGSAGLICDPVTPPAPPAPPGCHISWSQLGTGMEILTFNIKAPFTGSTISTVTWYCGSTTGVDDQCPGGTTLDHGMNYNAAEFQGSTAPGDDLSDSFHISSGCLFGDPPQNTFCLMDFLSQDGRVCPSTRCDTFEQSVTDGQPALAIAWSGKEGVDPETDIFFFSSDVEGAPEPSTLWLILGGSAVFAAIHAMRRLTFGSR